MLKQSFFITAMILGLFTIVANAADKVEPINEVFEPTGQFDSKKFGKVAVVQWNRSEMTPLGVTKQEAEAFKQESREELEGYIREAASNGAQLVVTPEFGIVGYPDIPELPDEEDNFRNREDIAPYVELANGPTAKYFGRLAKELGIYIHVGFAEVEGGEYFNTVIALDPKGKVAAKFRKINLYTHEHDFLSAGTELGTYTSQFGKVGMIICADVYSSDPMDGYKQAKTDVLALSTSWAQYNTGMSSFVRGAKWAGVYLLAANQNYFPDSGVIEPSGKKQSHIRQTRNAIAYGYLPYRK